MKRFRYVMFSAAALCCAQWAGAKLHLNPLVGDNMVVQQQAKARLWGTTDGKTVTVRPSWGEAVTAKADKDGRWMAEVATPAATFEAQTIEFADDKGDK
ncbi:MAG: 9-O-acetylesterase, partial [Muribaculaceae bacterium]|nr:9-O-acetylesterase [Muribaculaceae bacterium]